MPSQPLRGELRKKSRMEMLQDSYLTAVAASAGCTMAKPEPDDGIDWTLSHRSQSHLQDDQVDLKVQLKSTSLTGAAPESGFVSVQLSNRRFESLAKKRVIVHRIIVAMIIPEDVADWIEATHDYLSLRHCAYWRNIAGELPTGRTESVVRVATSQIFDDVSLCGIMERIGKGDAP